MVSARSSYAGSRGAPFGGANLSVLGAGANAEHKTNHETLSRDGNVKACGDSKRGDGEPPENCGALLRVELASLRAAGAGDPECGPGTLLVTHQWEAARKAVHAGTGRSKLRRRQERRWLGQSLLRAPQVGRVALRADRLRKGARGQARTAHSRHDPV